MGTRTWVKIFVDKWIDGTLRQEKPALRGLWVDLLAMVGAGAFSDMGQLKLSGKFGLTDEQIASIMNVQLSMWQAAKARLEETGRIHVGPNNIISILNWKKYQSEYRRQKPYRGDNKELFPKVTTPGDYGDVDVDVEIDTDTEENTEGEERRRRGGRKPSPAPLTISFNYETKKFEGITEQQIAFWGEAYPGVRIREALLRMAAYLDSNREKAPVRVGAFINNWLRGDQDKEARKASAKSRFTPDTPEWKKQADKELKKELGNE